MRRRPWVLVILAFLHLLAPLGNIVLNALFVKRNVLDYLIHAFQFEYLQRNWLIFIGPFVAGIAIYACKKWSFFVYLVSITALFIFSYSGYLSKADSISLLPVILVYIVNIVVVSYFLIPAVREIYFNPRLRWWESQPRYRCDIPCGWSQDSRSASGTVGNFSINGLFLKSEAFPDDESEASVKMSLGNGEEVLFKGNVILHGRQDAIGFGFKFIHTKESQSHAKRIVSELDKQGLKITYRAAGNEDSFIYWLKQLLTTGSGIVPEHPKKD